MTEDIKKAFELANRMIILSNHKLSLLDEFEQSTLFFYNGGCFKIDKILISFVASLLQLNQSTVVLLDQNDTPVRIEDLNKFTQDIMNCYFQASNKYLTEYQKAQHNRDVKSILEL